MAVGTLGLSDAVGSTKNSVGTPIRALDYRDDTNDVADGAGDPAVGFTRVSAASIVNGSYVIWQNETYVTVKDNAAAFAGEDIATWSARTDATTGIKGDTNAALNANGKGDVYNLRQNIFNSAAQFPPASVANPADELLSQGFIPPKLMAVKKNADGIRVAVANDLQDAALTAGFLAAPTYTTKFDVTDPAAITAGSGAKYGGGGTVPTGATINITANNYLFGDFTLDGQRDYADVLAAQKAQAKLALLGTSWTDGNNAAKLDTTGLAAGYSTLTGQSGTTGLEKGDLIVKGDFNADGKFDGADLYLLARGAALADNASASGLTSVSGATFADRVRNPNAVLRKNAALDALNAAATSDQKLSASANLLNDPTGANAFNKFDVNRDGLVNRADAAIVDKFVGFNVGNMQNQIDAVIAADGTLSTAGMQKLISLVDVELNDDRSIDLNNDFSLIRSNLGSAKLLDGDANFDGTVNFSDLLVLAANYNGTSAKWSEGDFTLDSTVNFNDLLGLAANYNGSVSGSFAADWALAQSMVPEPVSMASLGAAAGVVLVRRRRVTR
ncbi:MAG: PEP-CTERM sorting domain-containing protein [Tepidisphaeraceae bacterium]